MDFNKIIDDMKELQEKVNLYENKIAIINDVCNTINKDILKLEKKIEKETDLINKEFLQLKLLIMKDVLNKFEA